MIVNPGQLKHPYVVFSRKKGVDTQGFKTNALTEIVKGKCAITSIQTDDNSGSGAKEMDTKSQIITCIMRYHSSIDENCIVELNGKQRRIKSLLDINFQNKYLKLVLQDV